MLSAGFVVRSFMFDGKVSKRKKGANSRVCCSDGHGELRP